MAVFANDSRPLFPLYAILDADVATRAGWTLVDLASACLAGGAMFLQVRAKTAAGGWLLDTAAAIVERAHQRGALVLVNDRADIARLAGADGVHVGQDDLTPAAARAVLGDAALVGLSTHTPDQIDAALGQPISYLAIGPVFGTSTKSTGYDALGLEGVRQARKVLDTHSSDPTPPTDPTIFIQCSRGPTPARSHSALADSRLARAAGASLVAIGGITLDTAQDVLDAGARSVAVISDLLSTGDPEARVRAYVDRLHV